MWDEREVKNYIETQNKEVEGNEENDDENWRLSRKREKRSKSG